MKATLFILSCAMVITGCGSNGQGLFGSNSSAGGSAVGGAVVCPAVAYISNISIEATSPTALPQYLAVAINGGSTAFDACQAMTDQVAIGAVSVKTSGNTVQISIPLDPSATLYGSYFSTSVSTPINSTISVAIYGRSSCSDALALVTSRQDVSVPWQAIEPFSASCGIYGYSATVPAD